MKVFFRKSTRFYPTKAFKKMVGVVGRRYKRTLKQLEREQTDKHTDTQDNYSNSNPAAHARRGLMMCYPRTAGKGSCKLSGLAGGPTLASPQLPTSCP